MEVDATIQRERAAKFDFHTGVDQLTVHNFNIVSLHIDAFLSGQRLVLGHWGLALSYASYYAAFAWARCRFVNEYDLMHTFEAFAEGPQSSFHDVANQDIFLRWDDKP